MTYITLWSSVPTGPSPGHDLQNVPIMLHNADHSSGSARGTAGTLASRSLCCHAPGVRGPRLLGFRQRAPSGHSACTSSPSQTCACVSLHGQKPIAQKLNPTGNAESVEKIILDKFQVIVSGALHNALGWRGIGRLSLEIRNPEFSQCSRSELRRWRQEELKVLSYEVTWRPTWTE